MSMRMPPVPARGFDFSRTLASQGWFHSAELPDGTLIEGHNSLASLRERYARFPLPSDLAGRRVLDVGAWDGWFSFEAERRGAKVTAIDCVEIENFLYLRRAFTSNVDYRVLDLFEVPGAKLGKFDYVLFLGVLYHLKHPLWALEIVCGLTDETAIVESFVTESSGCQCNRTLVPSMEFYETIELGNQLDSWYGPSLECLMAMCRSAGFARVELINSSGGYAALACYRKWRSVCATPTQDAPELVGVANARNFGINFSSQKDEYVSCWFRSTSCTVAREDLRLEIGGYGAAALYLADQGDGFWMANFRLPPGLEMGWNLLRLRFEHSHFGSALRIAVDMPLIVERLSISVACDGKTWNRRHISLGESGSLSCWVQGLPENADKHNVRVYLAERRLKLSYVSDADARDCRQVNALVPSAVEPGEYGCRVECGGVSSEPWRLSVQAAFLSEGA
jgi:tRNA (mo5U34)-methyltransferase